MEDLNQGPPDFKSSALNHSATLPPACALSLHYKLKSTASDASCKIILRKVDKGCAFSNMLLQQNAMCNHSQCNNVVVQVARTLFTVLHRVRVVFVYITCSLIVIYLLSFWLIYEESDLSHPGMKQNPFCGN